MILPICLGLLVVNDCLSWKLALLFIVLAAIDEAIAVGFKK